ncbi:MAG: glycosyltransferase family 4 protein [Ignisphaera sp.]
MKVVMVNDCAFVGETLLKYMPKSFVRIHIKRGRGFLDKTFKLALRLLFCKGDIYHVHYLLQDSFLAGVFRKRPLVCHAHGSDLRSSLHHLMWGRIVKANLRMCDYVLLSTPDIFHIAREFREDAIYLPNPVDFELFYPKPMRETSGKKRILIASESNWSTKGTDIIIKALSSVKDLVEVYIISYGKDFARTLSLARELGLHVRILPKVSHAKVNQYYWNADVIIDQVKLGSLGLVSLEGIACGRPVIVYASSKYKEYSEFPMKDIQTEDEIAEAVVKADRTLWEMEYTYLINNHEPNRVVKKVLNIYKEAINRK